MSQSSRESMKKEFTSRHQEFKRLVKRGRRNSKSPSLISTGIKQKKKARKVLSSTRGSEIGNMKMTKGGHSSSEVYFLI
jgi:hypothetical protein